MREGGEGQSAGVWGSEPSSAQGYSLSGGKSATTGETAQAPPPSYQPRMDSKPAPVNGVKVTTVRTGDRKTFPKTGDMLVMHYVGKLRSTKKVFDSSVARGTPFEFQVGVGQVIPGWDLGVPQMSLGENAQLVIDADMAYGAAGRGNIPPNSDVSRLPLVEPFSVPPR